MKLFTAVVFLIASSTAAFPQDNAQKIYETERAFEKAVAEKGINAGFIEFMSPLGVMFFPRPENAREVWAKRPASAAALTWNPIKIEVSSNGALAYSIGNSIYRPKGKSDTTAYHGHYLSVWSRQPNGEYRAALDTGINHPTPGPNTQDWKPSTPPTPEANPKNKFAGDSSIAFYQMAEERGFGRAYKSYGAEDMYLMRDGELPVVGNEAAAKFIEKRNLAVRFTKRKSFIEAGDLAYVYSGYVLLDLKGFEKERGSFIQVWKLRGGHWLIAADVFVPIPPEKS
jgi:ketosteroid isomerase-like protein